MGPKAFQKLRKDPSVKKDTFESKDYRMLEAKYLTNDIIARFREKTSRAPEVDLELASSSDPKTDSQNESEEVDQLLSKFVHNPQIIKDMTKKRQLKKMSKNGKNANTVIFSVEKNSSEKIADKNP